MPTGKLSSGEGPYAAWTPRRPLKAAYNYQVASKDPGKLAHNAKYVIQLMYDSMKPPQHQAGAAGGHR